MSSPGPHSDVHPTAPLTQREPTNWLRRAAAEFKELSPKPDPGGGSAVPPVFILLLLLLITVTAYEGSGR